MIAAGALLPHDVLKMYLHCGAEELFRIWHTTVIGHLHANAIGYNAQYANGLAAMSLPLRQRTPHAAVEGGDGGVEDAARRVQVSGAEGVGVTG